LVVFPGIGSLPSYLTPMLTRENLKIKVNLDSSILL